MIVGPAAPPCYSRLSFQHAFCDETLYEVMGLGKGGDGIPLSVVQMVGALFSTVTRGFPRCELGIQVKECAWNRVSNLWHS